MGVGLGGFIDGILLHQILQWHHMLTGDNGGEPMNTVAGLETNTLADGLFHLTTWMFVAAAMYMTVRAWQRGGLAPPWRAHFGMLLTGCVGRSTTWRHHPGGLVRLASAPPKVRTTGHRIDAHSRT